MSRELSLFVFFEMRSTLRRLRRLSTDCYSPFDDPLEEDSSSCGFLRMSTSKLGNSLSLSDLVLSLPTY